MPVAFPSHQGLIAPLWRRWPERFNALACCIGAAAPDIVDGAIGISRGHLGQGIAHSLLGWLAFDIPLTVLLYYIVAPRWPRIDRAGAKTRRVIIVSAAVGAFSHLFFDFISHETFLWLYPYYLNARVFPEWWYHRWFEMRVPGYDHYPFAPHFLIWIALSVLGAVLYFRSPRAKHAERGGTERAPG